jgi:hypothetical protein
MHQPSSAASESRSPATDDGEKSAVSVTPPAPKRRLSGFWLALLAVIMLALIVAAMVLYRGSQTPPIITARPPVASGQPTASTDPSV